MSTTFFANILLNFGQIGQPVPKRIRNRFSVPEKSPKIRFSVPVPNPVLTPMPRLQSNLIVDSQARNQGSN